MSYSDAREPSKLANSVGFVGLGIGPICGYQVDLLSLLSSQVLL